MADSVAGLFRNRTEATAALRKLEEAGFGPDRVTLSTPRTGRRGHYGSKVLVGIVAGTLVGVIVGAVLTGLVPGMRPMIPGDRLALFLLAAAAGAGTGGLAGGLVSMAASGDRALYYEQEVESGRYLVSVVGPGLAEAEAILRASGAMEAAPVEAPVEERGDRPRPESG